jgi:hypothetical protein
MKLALCICGLTSNYEESYPKLKSRLLDNNDVDIYIHGWETDESRIEDIKQKYTPVKFIFEPPKSFNSELKDYKLNYSEDKLFKPLSYTYSRETCFNLIDKEYDGVLVCRFDVYNWHGLYNIPEHHLCVLEFNKDLDPNYIYSKFWTQLNAGFAEQWFYSSYSNIKVVCNLYSNLLNYLQNDSHYHKILYTDGWPASNISNEFSNEILKQPEERCGNLLTFNTDIAVLNHHYLYKYHIWVNNLLENCKYI